MTAKRLPRQKTDKQLVAKMKAGCEKSFEEFVKQYEAKIYHLALKLTRSPEDAEEVLQDVFTTIHRKIHLFEGKSAFSSWLYRIAVNAAFMKLRKNRQSPTISAEDLSFRLHQEVFDGDLNNNERTDQPLFEKEMRSILSGSIEKLPDQYKAVFVLRDMRGLTNQEVSGILSISVAAVKSRLHRARLMLRKKLQPHYQELYQTAIESTSCSPHNRAAYLSR